MSTLYELNDQIANLTEHLVDEETGEINEEVFSQLEQLSIDRDEKIEGCGIVMKNLLVEITALKAEIDNLKKRMTVKANKYERMAEYVKENLNGDSFETAKVAFSFRKSDKVEVVNEEIVPDDLCKFETRRSPMKTEIKKMLRAGEKVPGCVLVENANLQLK